MIEEPKTPSPRQRRRAAREDRVLGDNHGHEGDEDERPDPKGRIGQPDQDGREQREKQAHAETAAAGPTLPFAWRRPWLLLRPIDLGDRHAVSLALWTNDGKC